MIRYSHSRLEQYTKCPKAYQYKYLDREKEAFESIEAFMGSRVHGVIEAFFGTPGLSLDNGLHIYHMDWDHCWSDKIKVVKKGESVEQYRKLGEEIIRQYWPRLVSDELGTVAIERKVELQLDEGRSYVGYIDRLAVDATEALWIVDYKTSKHCPDEFIGPTADQLKSYALCLMAEDARIDYVKLQLEYVRHGKVLSSFVKRDDLPTIQRQLESRIRAAEVQSYTARPSVLCGWCGYNGVCPDAQGKTPASKKPAPF